MKQTGVFARCLENERPWWVNALLLVNIVYTVQHLLVFTPTLLPSRKYKAI
jgi:hypothetical protein